MTFPLWLEMKRKMNVIPNDAAPSRVAEEYERFRVRRAGDGKEMAMLRDALNVHNAVFYAHRAASNDVWAVECPIH